MKKSVLLTAMVVAFGMCVNAQTVIYEDNFESYDDGYNLTGAGYTVWEGTAKVSDITINGGTANGGNKFGQSDVSKNNFDFRKTFTLEAGKTYTWQIATKMQDGANHKLNVNPTAVYSSTTVNNADWQMHSITFTVVAGSEEVTLSLYRWPKKILSFDDYKLIEGTPTDIDDVEQSTVKIAPNPSNGVFKIISENPIAEYKVFNSVGQMVKEGSAAAFNEVTVDVAGGVKGLYMVQVTDETGNAQISKVIIK